AALLLELPLVLGWLKGKGRLPNLPAADKTDDRIFAVCCVFLALLTGALIPSAVIRSSPAEFVNVTLYRSPLWYVLSAALLAAGTFLIWCGIFYRLSGPQGRRLFGLAAWVLAGAAVTDYMFFGTHYGDISSTLVYDIFPVSTGKEILLNLLVLLAVAAVFYLAWRKKAALVNVAGLTLCLAVLCMSVLNLGAIHRDLRTVKASLDASSGDMPVIPLSKDGQNVVVLMMDRAIGYLVPFLMEEDPQLQEQFAGFTFYPNTLSYGSNTNIGTAALFGGYEYRPTEINKRADKPLVQEQNEALRLMPVLFDEAGYEVTVCDPTYAGYKEFPMDLSIYDDHPDIHACYARGKFSAGLALDQATEKSMYRNFFCFSIYKIAPLICQPSLYTQGFYNEADALSGTRTGTEMSIQTLDGPSRASGLKPKFLQDYAVLDNLSAMTEIREDDGNTFMMLCSEMTHEPTLLQLPDYALSYKVDNTEYDAAHPVRYSGDGRVLGFSTELQAISYHINMLGLRELGKWFDTLRENGVYDNTRIIIVADHGYNLGYEEMKLGPENWADAMRFNPLLMVKDFESQAYQVDTRFMTHCDVPLLAFDGIIEDPVNPATGTPVTGEAKQEPEQQVQYVVTWSIAQNHGNAFLPGHWFSVHDNILDVNNWQYLGDY
ncbi:MAG: sulfatase-like hydrolase/transferase, partial [Oscillospiraceae bacterium]|nr:sulfatase-like hydrolase/transferase [Oscillospiraceae bacterium]